jgi:hypothetical protein
MPVSGDTPISKITGLRFHDLRHTFASRLVEAGVSFVDGSNLLGHAQITTTMRDAHISSVSQRKAVESLSYVLKIPLRLEEQASIAQPVEHRFRNPPLAVLPVLSKAICSQPISSRFR